MSAAWNWKKHRKEKHQFQSYYCETCHQAKPCGVLYSQWRECCRCIYQQKQKQVAAYLDLAAIVNQQKQEQLTRIQQLIILKNYAGCQRCGSKEVDFSKLEKNGKLICHPCLVSKEGGATGEISWEAEVKWYQKRWGINLTEWLTKYRCLPVNKDCARQWLANPDHLPPQCGCLETKAQELHQLFTSSWKETQTKIKKCACQISPKIRVRDYDGENYGYTTCESCGKELSGAGKTGIIKNRNDPRFWGLKEEKKILCGECLEERKMAMTVAKRKEFNRYRKVGRLD